MKAPTGYPLQWPAGWPRTVSYSRERGRFSCTLAAALSNLQKQVELMGGKGLVLSSNCTLGDLKPKESGVVAYFTHDGLNIAIPCDRWQTVEANVQAIALTIQAMRGMERWGAKHMIKAMFTGFKALPESTGKRKWCAVFGCGPNDSVDDVLSRFRKLAFENHPDRGGSHEGMTELNNALEEFKAERGIA